MTSKQKIQNFLESIYDDALSKAFEKDIKQTQFKKEISRKMKKQNIYFKDFQQLVLYNKKDWFEDVLQITRDIKLVCQQRKQFQQKFENRTNGHFGKKNLQSLNQRKSNSREEVKVISMYKERSHQDWNELKLKKLKNTALKNTVYIVGLTKGNGIIIEGKYILTCAHAFMNQNDKIWKYRCFVTGNLSYGLVKIDPNGVWIDKDVAFAKIIKFYPKQEILQKLYLKIPSQLKYQSSFQPVKCIQLGLLFNNDPSSMEIKTFEPAQGFIQKNFYQSSADHRIVEEMGLLIHNCYGLWGTSGSPLWSIDGELLGIHNSWNENGYNVSMIVHDDQSSEFLVVKQYQRRAIGIHVLIDLLRDWKIGKSRPFRERDRTIRLSKEKGQNMKESKNREVFPFFFESFTFFVTFYNLG